MVFLETATLNPKLNLNFTLHPRPIHFGEGSRFTRSERHGQDLLKKQSARAIATCILFAGEGFRFSYD